MKVQVGIQTPYLNSVTRGNEGARRAIEGESKRWYFIRMEIVKALVVMEGGRVYLQLPEASSFNHRKHATCLEDGKHQAHPGLQERELTSGLT